MKRIIIALSAIAFLSTTACNNAADRIEEEEMEVNNTENVDPQMVSQSGTPQFNFEKESHDFGTIEEGTVAKYDFVFTNTGDAPLIITNASGSCGCTVPNWPKEPIAPGEKGVIHVEFDSNNRPGNATKQVTIDANTVPNTKILTINANVTPKAGSEQGAAPAQG